MSYQLTANTPQGAHMIGLAETLAVEVATGAAVRDRDGSYPLEGFAALRRSGYFKAPIPESLGGMGVTSVHDVLVACSRLAGGDPSLAIGVNMHFAYLMNVVRRRRAAGRRVGSVA